MNRLIRVILYITAGCFGIGLAALILSVVLGGGRAFENTDVGTFKQLTAVKAMADDIRKRIETHANKVFGGKDDAADYAEEYSKMAGEVFVDTEDDDSYDDEGDFTGLLTIDADSIEELEMDLRHVSLTVEESEDNLIRVSIDDPQESITAQCYSGKITVRDSRKGRSGRKEVSVYMEIPNKKRFKNISVKTNAGVIETDVCLYADTLTVSADAGEIQMDEVDAEAFTASVGAGVIEVGDGRLGEVELDCGIGTIEIDADIKKDSKISCGMGTVDLDLTGRADSVNYVLSCGAGSIEIGDQVYTSISGKGKRLENGAKATFALSCGMGSISID